MRRAVGTSLAIIALKSASGFNKYLGVLLSLNLSVDGTTAGLFIAIGIVGKAVSRRIGQLTLRRVFAAFLVVMGLVVLGQEAPRLFTPDTPAPATSATDAERRLTHVNEE